MERLPDQHGGVIQAPQGREVLHGRDNCLRRTEHQGSQDDPVGLLPVLQGQYMKNCARWPVVVTLPLASCLSI